MYFILRSPAQRVNVKPAQLVYPANSPIHFALKVNRRLLRKEEASESARLGCVRQEHCMVPRKIKGMPCLSMRIGRCLLMLHLAERWGSPSSPLLLSHSEGGVIWLPRPSAVLVASWARDLASPLPSPLANCFRGRCGEGMLPFGYTVFLQSPLSLTVLSDNIYII